MCIKKAKLNSSFSLRIPRFSDLQTNCTHSRAGILSSETRYASSGIIIFVRQGFSFSKLFNSSFSLLDPYSDYVRVNISLNNFSSLSFLNVYAPPIRSSSTNSRTDFFSPSIFSSSRNLFILDDFNCHHLLRVLSTIVGRKYSIGHLI